MSQLPLWMNKWFEQSLNQFQQGFNTTPKTVTGLNTNDYIHYDDLSSQSTDLTVAIVKLNGGLGTSMGCKGPKSLIPIHPNGDTFLDSIIRSYQQNLAAEDLILLNSFNTSLETNEYLNKSYPNLKWHEVQQAAFKKIDLKTNQPFKSNEPTYFNPPGHGSVFFDLYYSGELKRLLDKGIDYIFISNSDNLAANLDNKIMNYLDQSKCPFLMELIPKTPADVKGGTVMKQGDRLTLWEVAQVAEDQLDLFKTQPVFNTNNIWVSVPALIEKIELNQLHMDLIQNKKNLNGSDIVQLEYAMGSAIQSFNQAKVIIVPRKRFFPVKKTSDLLLLVSDYCHWSDSGDLIWDDNKNISVELAAPYDTVDGFFEFIKVIPCLKDASSIYLNGPIIFDVHSTFIGDIYVSSDSITPLQISRHWTQFKNIELT